MEFTLPQLQESTKAHAKLSTSSWVNLLFKHEDYVLLGQSLEESMRQMSERGLHRVKGCFGFES